MARQRFVPGTSRSIRISGSCANARRGPIGNVNARLQQANGEYFLFAFHDGPPMPNCGASLVEAFEGNPCAELAFSGIQLTN